MIVRAAAWIAGLAVLGGCSPSHPPVAALAAAPVAQQVDYSCRVDADCVVKDVGNCCGHYPACVNATSPTFPEQVAAECARTGSAGICGYPEITGCRCVAQRCSAVTDAGEVR